MGSNARWRDIDGNPLLNEPIDQQSVRTLDVDLDGGQNAQVFAQLTESLAGVSDVHLTDTVSCGGHNCHLM
jgi:hypothetical protein